MKDKKKTLRILGYAPSTLHEAFIDIDGDVEIWGINSLYNDPIVRENLNRFTRWFDIHSRRDNAGVSAENMAGKVHISTLNNLDIPIYVQELHGDIKNETLFPAYEIVQFFRETLGMNPYFSSTASWEMGFAIYEGFKDAGGDPKKFKWNRIELLGVDMAMGWRDGIQNEYSYQRPSCEWLIGLIQGLHLVLPNVEFYLPEKSTLMKYQNFYGYETAQENNFVLHLKERSKYIKGQIAGLESQKAELINQYTQKLRDVESSIIAMNAVKSELDYELSQFVHPAEESEGRLKEKDEEADNEASNVSA